VCKELFENHTQPLLERWKDSLPFIRENKGYAELFHSFEFDLTTRTIIVPWQILIFETLGKPGIYSQLRQTEDLDEFLFYFQRSFGDMNLRLNDNDIRILRGLTSQEFFSKTTRYPTLEQMAKICGCNRRTFSRRFDRLLNSYSFFTIYRLNTGNLGYETFISITPQRSTPEDPQNVTAYHLMSIPLDVPQFFIDNKRYNLLISQFPYQNNRVYTHLKHEHQPSLLQQMSHSYIGWNLRSLTPSVENRWRTLPPIISVHDWSDKMISEDNGITYDLIPQPAAPKLSPIETKILSWYVKRGTLQDTYLARSLGVTPKYISETVTYLLKKRLMHKFTIVDNIGLTLKPWIILLGRKEYEITPEFIDNIVEHLKFFPFVNLFYDYGNSSGNVRPVVTGIVWLPPTWIATFSDSLSRLSKHGFDVHISYNYGRVVKWNISIADTYSYI
jgi:AraC-like DNA-binding protein